MNARGLVTAAAPMLSAMASAGAALCAYSVFAAPSTASREFVVQGKGGAFEVEVTPKWVTVFYLPDEVTQALASDQKNFFFTIKKNTVAIRPVTDQQGLTSNLNIETPTMHVSVILRVGLEANAVSQVIFSRAEDAARLNEEVERRMAPLRQELEARTRTFDTEVRKAADMEIGRRMGRRVSLRTVNARARTDDHVIIAVERALRLGDDIYLSVSIHNRSARPYVLGQVLVTQAQLELRPVLIMDSTTVSAGQRATAVVVFPAEGLVRKLVDVRIMRGDKTELVISGIWLD